MSPLRSTLVWWLCLLVLVGAEPNPPTPLTQALNQKALKVWRNLAGDDKSSCFSPASLWFMLELLETGSGPGIEKQVGKFLALPSPVSPSLQTWRKRLCQTRGFRSANSFWHTLGGPLQPAFQKLLDHQQRVDFAHVEQVCQAVNGWADRATGGMISKLLKPSDIDGAEALLLNAVLLDARWKQSFDPRATREAAFRLTNGGTLSLPMMRQSMMLWHFHHEEAEGVLLDYSPEQGWSYLAIKPSEGKTLAQLEAALDAEKLQQWVASAELGSALLTLPRYRSSAHLDLTGVLKSDELAAYFKPGADLSRISKQAKGLYLSKLLQDVLLEVNENGTKAAAVTVAVATRSVPEEISFDRPFLYFVLDAERTILFMGRFAGR